MNEFPFHVVTGKSAYRIVHEDVSECVRVVRDAYLAHDKGDSINPNSYFLRFPAKPSSRIIALPAYLGGETDAAGIKWIASFPENVQKGFPRASAALLLNDYATGYPFACLEASVISAARTAASAVLAASTLRNENKAESLAIVGTGLISRYVYRFLMSTGWSIDEVRLFDTNAADAARFRDSVCAADRHTSIAICDDIEAALRPSDLVLFATTAAKPHVSELAMFRQGTTVLHLSLRDLAPELIVQVQNVVDDVGHVMNADTSPHLAEKMTGGRAFVSGTLAEIITGSATIDRSRTTVFSPFGLGVLDLAVGRWIYERAVRDGESVRIDDFFFDLER